MGQGSLLSARWSTLWTQLQTPDGRLQHWRDALACVPEFWSLGSGLGTYRYVYLLHSSTPRSIWFYHAENQYLESTVEGGWLGLALVLVLLGLCGLACRKLLAEPPMSLSFALGVCAVFALVSQAVHSAFDFGLYIPSNMALFALMMGSACGLAAQLSARQQALARRDSPRALDRGTKSMFRSGRSLPIV
jgi:O-antigen ligase